MILSYTDFFNSGLPTSSDISQSEIEFAVKTIEQTIVRPYLTTAKYIDIIDNPSAYTSALNGTSSLAGLKFAECNLVFAYLLMYKYRLTRYSSVIKSDEHSTDIDYGTLLQIARQYWEIGIIHLREVCDVLGVEYNSKNMNSLIFGELYY